MINYKIYTSDTAGKAEFVREVISPLLIYADTGWYGAEYEQNESGEYVYLLTEEGVRGVAVDITRDSLQAIVCDVFKCNRYSQSYNEYQAKKEQHSFNAFEVIENYLHRETRDSKSVAIAMRNIRKSCRLSIKELSALVDIPQSTLSMYECGNRNPSLKNLDKIMTAFKALVENKTKANVAR